MLGTWRCPGEARDWTLLPITEYLEPVPSRALANPEGPEGVPHCYQRTGAELTGRSPRCILLTRVREISDESLIL